MAIAERTNRNHAEEVDDIMIALFGECSFYVDDSDQSDNEPTDNASINGVDGSDESTVSNSDLEQSEGEDDPATT